MDRALHRYRFDVIHVHEPFTPLVAAAAVLLATQPVVATFHAALDGSLPYAATAAIVRRLAARIDVRIAVSEAARRYPADHLPGEYRVIPNGVNVDDFVRAAGAARVSGRICFIGRPEKRKGLVVLLAAFTELRRRQPQATLCVIGATRRQILEELHAAGAPPFDLSGIEVQGWVTEDEKIEQLARAEIVCAPSLTAESFGIVLVEAMAAGVPVVASDLPGYRAVLRDGTAGRLVPPNNPLRLAEALEDLLGNPVERARLTAAGLEAARELSWARVADQITGAYEDALELRRRSESGFGQRHARHDPDAEAHPRWDGQDMPELPVRVVERDERVPFCPPFPLMLDSLSAVRSPGQAALSHSSSLRGRSSAG